jgi:hypothetical protein
MEASKMVHEDPAKDSPEHQTGKSTTSQTSCQYKFGYQVPRDYDEAMLLGKVNGNCK